MADSGFLDDLTQANLTIATRLLCALHLYLRLSLRFFLKYRVA